ncbi:MULTISPECIES: glycosyltransferase family 4 protein [Methylobacterium]|uniref:Glycosyltransferase family 4 protein n=1 Tax=Methylobacterium longum TaxID=767694 RepID=A0ABT8AL49_9HYPH|nr:MULTISPECIES: glycosyltransferase family 4 protein [Methylobacterium]MCJ2101658.1 glycosyltransferase family 4 protein [Methylobacterium sp. E-046]MDN3570637.1 glycosyltransferase family 4 protein [Methylobacterium longum]GJE09781.1 D-inositol-3-phosphate glycosyltransferase [Methylobacterium longum]
MIAKTNDTRNIHRYRILHVFRAPVGGLFRHVMDLARLQAAAGHAVGIVCDSTTGGERGERALADLMPYLELGLIRIPMRRNPHASDWSCLRAVSKRAATVGAEVIHGHGAKGGAYARLASAASAIRAYTPHGGSYNYRPGSPIHRLYMAAEAVLARRTDAFLFESEYVAGRHQSFVGGPERVTRIVHNGIAEAEFAPVERVEDPFDLLYVGELREAKGLPYLLEALVRLRAEGRTLRLLMVGSGPDAEILRQTVERMGLADAVAFEPPQAIRSVLARGRILVVPSLAESLPYVVLEAAAAAQPLVATRVGGIPEIFGPAAGDLVPAREPEALAEGIRRVLDDAPDVLSARVHALSASIRQRFSLERMGSEVIAGYASAFQARQLPRTVEAPGIAGPRTA